MKKHKIVITETRKRVIEVQAGNLPMAISKVIKEYAQGGIDLLPHEAIEYSIKEYKEE